MLGAVDRRRVLLFRCRLSGSVIRFNGTTLGVYTVLRDHAVKLPLLHDVIDPRDGRFLFEVSTGSVFSPRFLLIRTTELRLVTGEVFFRFFTCMRNLDLSYDRDFSFVFVAYAFETGTVWLNRLFI